MEKRVLSLIVLAHAGDVLENAFAPLSDEVREREYQVPKGDNYCPNSLPLFHLKRFDRVLEVGDCGKMLVF